jgi:RHS repeat-associated protein
VNNRTSLGDLGYTWDANKNKTSESITGVMSGYGFTSAGTTYDNEDRLTGFSRAATSGPALLSQSWSLTAVGDWTSVTTNGTAQNRTHGPTHELLTAGDQNVATDVKGNITTLPVNLRPSGSTTAMNLTWDSDNKLRSAEIDANGTADVNFQYDSLGRRVARSGTGGSVVYVQMDQQTIADYPVGGAATTPTFRYVYASYIDEPVVRKTAGTGGTLVYFHRNQQYSVTAITTSAGAIAERYAYSAYGQPTVMDASASVLSSSAINNRYTYTGREWDQTLDLHHFRARWMSPSAGRFLSRDPIAYKGSPYCLYEAFDSRSLQETDPSGMGIRTWICKSLLRGSLYPCWEFARIFDEFDSDCQRDRDSDLVEFIDHYADRGGAYCGCIGALCPDSSLYKSQYADLCCILIKVRKAEIRFGEPDSEKFRRSIGLCLKAIIGNIVI